MQIHRWLCIDTGTNHSKGLVTMATELSTAPKQAILFSVTRETIADMRNRFQSLKVNGIGDKTGLEAVHKARMDCVKARSAIEKSRKEMKEESLRIGRQIDSEAKALTAEVEQIEQPLIDQEAAIVKERERIAKEQEDLLFAKRSQMLVAIGGTMPESVVRKMSQLEFELAMENLVEELKRRKEEEERRAEEKRLADLESKRQQAEAARLAEERAELERLKIEQEREVARLKKIEDDRLAEERAVIAAQQAAIKAEQDRISLEEKKRQEAIALENAKAEAAEAARVETEARIKREAAEEKARAEALEAERKRTEELRPAKEKLIQFAESIAAVPQPWVSVKTNKLLASKVASLVSEIQSMAADLK